VPLAPAEFDAHVGAEIGTTGVLARLAGLKANQRLEREACSAAARCRGLRALMRDEAPIRLSAKSISEAAKIDDRDLIESARSPS